MSSPVQHAYGGFAAVEAVENDGNFATAGNGHKI